MDDVLGAPLGRQPSPKGPSVVVLSVFTGGALVVLQCQKCQTRRIRARPPPDHHRQIITTTTTVHHSDKSPNGSLNPDHEP